MIISLTRPINVMLNSCRFPEQGVRAIVIHSTNINMSKQTSTVLLANVALDCIYYLFYSSIKERKELVVTFVDFRNVFIFH